METGMSGIQSKLKTTTKNEKKGIKTGILKGEFIYLHVGES